MTDRPKGQFTFRFAAVCFGLSAVWELFSLHEAALLFGAMVGGVGAAVYHVVYTVLFAWLTIGLWTGSRSGYYTLIATTIFYTVDRLQVLLVGNALELAIRQELAGQEDLLSAVGMNYVLRVLTITIIVFVLCWWAFLAYAYRRRSYFGVSDGAPSTLTSGAAANAGSSKAAAEMERHGR